LDISNEKQDKVTIVTVVGRLDAPGAPKVEAYCRALIQDGSKHLLIDMTGVDYVSSAGLRSLLVLAKAVKAVGGAMVLCGLSPTVHEVMRISGFDNILSLAADRSSALDLMK
jgi:anti-anti-sigma factor